jgi:hypothetical protein
MLQELRSELESHKASTQQKLEDQRVQLQNAQRVQGQQFDSAADDLLAKCAKQEAEIRQLN